MGGMDVLRVLVWEVWKVCGDGYQRYGRFEGTDMGGMGILRVLVWEVCNV